MSGFVIFLIVLAFVVISRLGRHAGASSTSRRERIRTQANLGFQQARQQLQSLQQMEPGDGAQPGWPPRPPGAASMTPPAGAQSGTPPNPFDQPAVWQAAAWAPTADAPTLSQVQPFLDNAGAVVDALRADPDVRAVLSDIDASAEALAGGDPTAGEEVADPTSSSLVAAPPERYVGSAALESTLDSTIESSLMGLPAGSSVLSVLPGGPGLDLTDDVRSQVEVFVTDGHEVAAVRLICDEMGCGILEAMNTVRSLS